MRLPKVCVPLVVVLGLVLASRAGVAQTATPCGPASCRTGQTCVNDACVAPAPSPAAVVPAAAPPPLWHEGKMVVPFVGINSFQGDSGINVGVGLRVGTFLGSRVSERWSLNAEVALDVMNLDSSPGVTASGYMIDLAFAPLIHIPQEKVELVIGPILGPWSLYEHLSTPVGSGFNWSIGWVAGVNAGILFPVGQKVHVGGLLSFVSRNPVTSCVGGTGVTETCTGSGLQAAKVLGFAVAAML